MQALIIDRAFFKRPAKPYGIQIVLPLGLAMLNGIDSVCKQLAKISASIARLGKRKSSQ